MGSLARIAAVLACAWVCVWLPGCAPAGPVDSPALAAEVSGAPVPEIDSAGRFGRGFVLAEAASLLDLCSSFDAGAPRPTGWVEVGASGGALPVFGSWQNTWRLWRRTDQPDRFAIAIRGTIEAEPSILEDVVATSSIARPELQAWSDAKLAFTLSTLPGAETHLGFTYGLAYLMFTQGSGILAQLAANVPPGSKIFITGHSQGAAVATLAHAFLHYAINDPGDHYHLQTRGYSLKSYVFAQPKPGNNQFAFDFARIAASRGVAYVVNNSRDWVPQVPLTLEFLDEPQTDLVAQLGQSPVVTALKLGSSVVQGVRTDIADMVGHDVLRELQAWSPHLDPQYRTLGAPRVTARPISINYGAAGNLIPLIGQAPAPGSPESKDWLYQHHLPTYASLLRSQWGTSPP